MSIFGNAVGAAMNHLMKISGGILTGDLNMDGHDLTGLAAPTADNQAANKQYVDKAVKPKIQKFAFTLTLPADRWAGTEAPYTQSLAVEGILETDTPYFGLQYSADGKLRLDEKLAFSCIDELETGEGSLTFACFENKPVTDLNLQMEVFR